MKTLNGKRREKERKEGRMKTLYGKRREKERKAGRMIQEKCKER